MRDAVSKSMRGLLRDTHYDVRLFSPLSSTRVRFVGWGTSKTSAVANATGNESYIIFEFRGFSAH